jgi:hypothetical protein
VFTEDCLPIDDDILWRLFGEEVRAGDIPHPMSIMDVWKNSYSENTSRKVWAATLRRSAQYSFKLSSAVADAADRVREDNRFRPGGLVVLPVAERQRAHTWRGRRHVAGDQVEAFQLGRHVGERGERCRDRIALPAFALISPNRKPSIMLVISHSIRRTTGRNGLRTRSNGT